MSSYHNSFSYLGKNSKEDFNWIITHFSDNTDSGETDTFLSTSAVYSDSYDGTRQTFYGAKYDTVATPQITVIKQDGTDFGIDDNRKALRWLTGSKQASWMDFYIGDEVKYRLLGRVKSVSQYKMDARIIGLILTFESVSPYGYSSLQTVKKTLTGEETINIPCDSDDVYSYVYMNTTFKNTRSEGSLVITNSTTKDTPTEVTGLAVNEIITISDNMMITSNKSSKTFGGTFNFVFPRLTAGNNALTVKGVGSIEFQYIVPVKLGDIAININAVSDPICDSDGNIQIDTLSWSRIVDTPTTLSEYGITNAYTKTEVDNKISAATNSTVTWNKISNKPTTVSGYGITDVYTKSQTYTKSEIDSKISSVEKDISNTVTSDLSKNYYTKSHIDNNFYNTTEVDEKINTVNEKVMSAESDIDEIVSNLNQNYYTKSDINNGFYTTSELDSKLSQITTDIKTIEGAVNDVESDLSQNYYTKSNVDDNFYNKSSIDDNYYTKSDVDKIVSQIKYDPETGTPSSVTWNEILNKPTDLSGYGVKTEVQSMIDASVSSAQIDIDATELNSMLTEVLV